MKETDKQRDERLQAKSKQLFVKLLDELGFVAYDHDDQPAVKFEGTLNGMRDSAVILAGLTVRMHELLLPIAYATYENEANDLERMSAMQKHFLTKMVNNYEEFLSRVVDLSDDEKVFFRFGKDGG